MTSPATRPDPEMILTRASLAAVRRLLNAARAGILTQDMAEAELRDAKDLARDLGAGRGLEPITKLHATIRHLRGDYRSLGDFIDIKAELRALAEHEVQGGAGDG